MSAIHLVCYTGAMVVFRHVLGSVEELRSLYREPSKMVQSKKVSSLDEPTRAFIAASPFVLLIKVVAPNVLATARRLSSRSIMKIAAGE